MVMSVMWFLLSCHGAAVQLLQAGHQIDGRRSGLHLLECVLVHVLAHGVDADHTLHVLLRQTIHGGVQGIALACHNKHSFLWVAPTTLPGWLPSGFDPFRRVIIRRGYSGRVFHASIVRCLPNSPRCS
nr:MAG TPA: hypothetical protein [Caudoviricetes sp.]